MDSDALKNRTKEFAHRCVKLALNLPDSYIGNHIRGQLIRCSTSVAANYRAACLAQSKASFISKLSIVIEEADESYFWLEFIIDEKLMAKGDPQLLRVLLENLLSNAVKFTRNTKEARIEFGSKNDGETKTYFIRDNGAGFDMAFKDKLFGAFQRLHDEAEFPGTGIGLATVQRIINRHGGEISAEGALGEGATFYFTLN